MSKTCKAYLIENETNSDYLVNTNNLAAFLYQHRAVKEIVVTGVFFDTSFVLSMKKGAILFCSDELVKCALELEMSDFQEQAPHLYLYEVLVNACRLDTVKIFSDSRWQAMKDFTQWSKFPPLMIKLA